MELACAGVAAVWVCLIILAAIMIVILIVACVLALYVVGKAHRNLGRLAICIGLPVEVLDIGLRLVLWREVACRVQAALETLLPKFDPCSGKHKALNATKHLIVLYIRGWQFWRMVSWASSLAYESPAACLACILSMAPQGYYNFYNVCESYWALCRMLW